MIETTSGKIFLFNLLTAVFSFGAIFYGLESLPLTLRYFLYPLIAYTMLSFIAAAIGIGLGMNGWERRKNAAEKKAAVANGIYLVAVIVGVFFAFPRLIGA